MTTEKILPQMLSDDRISDKDRYKSAFINLNERKRYVDRQQTVGAANTPPSRRDKTDEWTTIATATNSGSNQLPTNYIRSKEYSIEDNMNAYRYFRFEATPGNTGFLLSELQFMEVSEKIDVSWRMEGGLSQAKGLSETNNTNCVINGNTAELMTDSHTKTMRYTWNSGTGLLWTNSISERYSSFGYASFYNPLSNGCVVTFPNIKGKVTGLKMTNLDFHHDSGDPKIIKMYVGTKNGNNTSLMQINGNDYLESNSDGIPFTANFTSVGIDVDENNPLTIWFEGDQDIGDTAFSFSGSYHSTYGRKDSILTLSYVPAAEPDAGHSFDSSNISVNGNVLTATCNSDDADHNALYGGANHKYTLTLNAEDGVFSYYSSLTAFSATLTPSLTDFNTDTQLNATCTFNYHNNDTGADNTTPPHSIGKRSKRVLKISPYIMGILKELKDEQNEEALRLGDKWVESARLFVKWNGEPMNNQTPYGWLKEFCEKNDMPFYGIHSFRHFVASALISSGLDVVTVSGALGHCNSGTTLNVYAHMFQTAQARVAQAMDGAFSFLPQDTTT